jgi:hypothetical protein
MKQAEERLLSEALGPFNVSTRNSALEMARLYAVLYCFENEVRILIRETAESRQKVALEDSWLEGEKADILGFVDFGQLASIIIEKWQYFEDIMPTATLAETADGRARES